MNQPELQPLINLLTLDIPESPARELGFLDVAGHPTRETTICNVYRYFLDPELSPQINPLMIEALEELIEEKYLKKDLPKELDLTDFKVRLEMGTGSGRIDIVLDSPATKSAVIIEVKIYHWLHNDLADYWKKFSYPDKQKAGIVLSLESMSETQIGNFNFVSITHSEWLNRVCGKGLPTGLPIKDYIYFNDFVNNMNHLTKSTTMNEQTEFYFEHSHTVEKAIDTKKQAWAYVLSHLKLAVGDLGMELTREKEDWSHIKKKKLRNFCLYTIFPSKILKGKKLRMHIELQHPTEEILIKCREIIERDYQHLNLIVHKINPKAKTPIITKEANLRTEDLKDLRGYLKQVLTELEPIWNEFNKLAPARL